MHPGRMRTTILRQPYTDVQAPGVGRSIAATKDISGQMVVKITCAPMTTI
jgi:hypothetical protein